MVNDGSGHAADSAGAGGATHNSGNDAASSLVASAATWMREALSAWAEDQFGKVAALAPLGVEHLGKAVLWRANPVLLLPLSSDAEASLFSPGPFQDR